MSLHRPRADEHAPYYGLYISQAPEGDILEAMARLVDETQQLLAPLTDEEQTFRYQAGKWSPREIIGHLIDTEWTFTYRAIFFARADPATLPPFDQDLWSRTADAHERPMADLLHEFSAIRKATIATFRSFRHEDWVRRGTANHCEFTVRAMPFILAGHELHHRKVLVERYLNQPTNERSDG